MKLKFKTALLTIIGAVAFVGLAELINEDSGIVFSNSDGEKKYEIKINENGQTYGSELSTKEYDDGPDLISVEMNNGETGYVYRDDFYDNANQPNNPDEAVEYMKNLNKTKYREVNVYDINGENVIGTYKIIN